MAPCWRSNPSFFMANLSSTRPISPESSSSNSLKTCFASCLIWTADISSGSTGLLPKMPPKILPKNDAPPLSRRAEPSALTPLIPEISCLLFRNFDLSSSILRSRSISWYFSLNFVVMTEIGRPRQKMPPSAHAQPTALPQSVMGVMSPYPTVVRVMTAKYMPVMTLLKSDSSTSMSGFSQKNIPDEKMTTAMTKTTPMISSSLPHPSSVVPRTLAPELYFPSLKTMPMMRKMRVNRNMRTIMRLDPPCTPGIMST
mmetsp:Transcript_13437/g.34467  ORF Transcript_13437/g.34467 Transcript_13437/m.34467 type:complete len:256 (+) Transcript_13437:224-991(+)